MKRDWKAMLKYFWRTAPWGWWCAAVLAVMMLILGPELRDLRKETRDQAVKIQRLELENADLKSKVTP